MLSETFKGLKSGEYSTELDCCGDVAIGIKAVVVVGSLLEQEQFELELAELIAKYAI